jgi:AcrR family transcriptional regulator
VNDNSKTAPRTPPSRRPGRPTPEEAAALGEEVLDRAIERLRSSGAERLSLDQLAVDANVTKRTIYHRFGSKDRLVDAAVERELSELGRIVVDGTARSDDPMEILQSWARQIFIMSVDPEIARFANFLSFEGDHDESLRPKQKLWHSRLITGLLSHVESAQTQGALQAADPLQLALLLFDLMTGAGARIRSHSSDHEVFGGKDRHEFFDCRWTAFLNLANGGDAAHRAAGPSRQ